MHWLQGLDEAEPPRNLVHNIMAQTMERCRRSTRWQSRTRARAGGNG